MGEITEIEVRRIYDSSVYDVTIYYGEDEIENYQCGIEVLKGFKNELRKNKINKLINDLRHSI